MNIEKLVKILEETYIYHVNLCKNCRVSISQLECQIQERHLYSEETIKSYNQKILEIEEEKNFHLQRINEIEEILDNLKE